MPRPEIKPETLYLIFGDAQDIKGVSIPVFEELDDIERDAWQTLADRIDQYIEEVLTAQRDNTLRLPLYP